MKLALTEVGTPFSEEEIRVNMGTSKREMFRRLVEQELRSGHLDDVRVEEIHGLSFALSMSASLLERAIERVEAAFSELRERSVKIALPKV